MHRAAWLPMGALALLLTGCGEAVSGSRPVPGRLLELEPRLMNLRPGDEVALRGTVSPAVGDERFQVAWLVAEAGAPATLVESLVAPGNSFVRLFRFATPGERAVTLRVDRLDGRPVAEATCRVRVWSF